MPAVGNGLPDVRVQQRMDYLEQSIVLLDEKLDYILTQLMGLNVTTKIGTMALQTSIIINIQTARLFGGDIPGVTTLMYQPLMVAHFGKKDGRTPYPLPHQHLSAIDTLT